MLGLIQTKKTSISLDELDLLLIEQLKNDARQPVSALSRNVGVNRETVRYRLNRLISEGAVTIVCTSNVECLGYQFMLVIGVRARPGRIDAVASQLAGLSGVMAVSLAASRYNIMVWTFIRDQSDLAHFVLEKLANIPDATSIEIMYSFHLVKEFWRPLKSRTQIVGSYTKDSLSDFDLTIIKAMQQKPRQTITQLARTIGCSRTLASKGLDRLIEDGIIGFWPIVDPTVLGYNYWVVILIKSEPDKVSAVANGLSALDVTMHVSLITGQWQVYVIALFEDSRHMFNFTSETLSAIPGIIESEAIPLGKSLKFSINFVDWM